LDSDFTVQAFWSFRSPYSYLAVQRMREMALVYRLEWDLRIVYPLAIRKPEHFQNPQPLARPYFYLDSQREAQRLNLPFRRPVPDPIVQDPGTLRIAAEQPYIRPLTRLGVQAVRRGQGLPFIDEVSRLLWGGMVDQWHTGDHLAQAAQRAGLDLADMEASIAADIPGHEAQIEDNQAAHAAAGHWGVPTFAFHGEAFFGQDRMDTLLWRLRLQGLPLRRGLAAV
jgi:2-hydroxychromene-2-carboxylate isomerase